MVEPLFRFRIGRRGAVLLVFAVMFGAFGFQVLHSSIDRQIRLVYLYTLAPQQVWASVWWIVAGIAAIHAFGKADAIAFAALEALAAVWAGAQWVALLLAGNLGAGVFAILFTAIVILLRIIDGWVEVPHELIE